jgi:chromosome segregation ATPase
MTLVHANVVEGTSGLSKQIDLSNNLVNDYIEKFGGEFQRISDQQISAFEKATVEISESVRQNFTDISEIKVSLTDNIVNELNVLKNQLDSITNLTEANNVALEKSSEINEKASQILLMSAERLPSLIADLENISTPISRSSEEIADIVQSLVSFNENISESQQSLTNFSIATSGATKNLKATAKAIDNSSNQLAEDIESIYLSLGKQLKELRGSVD